MFAITLSPQVSEAPALDLSVAGSTLTINGDTLDLSDLQEGDALHAEAIDHPAVVGLVRMTGGVIQIRLVFPIRPGAPDEARFPEPIIVTANGPVALPPNGD